MKEQPDWEMRSNIFQGESIWVYPGADLSTIPSPHQELITEAHRRVFANPGDYLQTLANRCELPGMKQWLLAMAKANRVMLQIHRVEMYDIVQTDVTVRGFLSGPQSHSDFFVAKGDDLSSFPEPLRHVYSLINGTVDGGIWEGQGLNKFSDLIFDLSSLGLAGVPPIRDPSHAITFYCDGGGDSLVADENCVYWFLHGSSNFVEAGDLTKILDRYFTAKLTDGWLKPWLPNPYD